MSTTPLIPVILGPTAVGKTEVGIELARQLEGEIISVDSRKVYKFLRIGTATPSGEWENGAYMVNGIAHHLINHLSPEDAYNAGDFARDAKVLINEITGRNKVPILVGGTGFYFKALAEGLPALPPRNDELRQKLTERLKRRGHQTLHDELAKIDPCSARGISPKDSHKLIRALEVFHLTGQPFSHWKNARGTPADARFLVMGLHMNKGELWKKIEGRSKRMYENGMIEEAKMLLNKGFSKNCPALASFGYREAVHVIEGILPREKFVEELIKGTKAYAKRQNTWFRTQVKPVWFDCEQNISPFQLSLKMKHFLKKSMSDSNTPSHD